MVTGVTMNSDAVTMDLGGKCENMAQICVIPVANFAKQFF
jgi:hypothetical protein